MRIQFASGLPQLPFSSANLSVISGSTTTARSLYFAILGENPAGFNLLSSIIPATIGVGAGAIITIPTTAHPAGSFWQNYIIAASTTNTPSSFVQLAKISAIDLNGNPRTLPLSVTLDEEEAFALSATIATPDLLPELPLNGMLRAIASLSGNVFEYDENSTLPPNDVTVIAAIVGNWVYKPGNFSSYVEFTTDGGGCDRPLADIPSTLQRAPRYNPSGAAGTKRTFWIVNTAEEDIEAGLRVKVIVSVDGTAQDSQFDGLLSVRFKGYANTVTGALRTLDGDGIEFPNLNVERDYQSGKSDLILPDDLATNEAYTLEIYPKFSLIAAQNKVADGSLISIALDLFEEAGVYSELGQALGDWLYPSDDRGYVVPDDGLAAIALKRSGIVASTSFLKVGASPLYGLDIDAAGQKAAINGDGAIYLRDGALQPAEALRAILGTVAGDSKPCAWSLPITTSGTQAVQVTCTYPSNGTTATIRADYPDAIAGVTGKAKFNPPLVTLFLTDGSEIRRFEGFSVVDGVTQDFLITNWNSGVLITTLPNPAANFSLFRPEGATAIATATGTIPAGSIRAAFCFTYTGETLTSISHAESDGCIHEAKLTLAEMEAAAQSWSTPVAVDDIRAIPQGAIVAWQTRRTTSGKAIIYNPVSTAIDNGVDTWKPAYKLTSDPGRWLVDNTQKVLLTGENPPTSGQGNEGDIYLQIASPDLLIWHKDTALDWALVQTITAPTGAPGQAYTNTTAAFIQPAVNTTVTVAIVSGDWMTTGATVFVESAGYYQVVTPGTTSVVLRNLGYSANASPTTNILSNRKITASGTAGATGSVSDADRLILNLISTPPTVAVAQMAVFNQGEKLKLRKASNGVIQTIAVLEATQTFTKAQAVQPVALTYGFRVAIDASLSNTFTLNIPDDCILSNPTGLVDGGVYYFRLTCTTGGNSIQFGSAWKWAEDTTPNLFTAANRLWLIEANSDGTYLYARVYGWFAAPALPFAYWTLDDSSYTDSIAGRNLAAETGALINIVNNAAVFTAATGVNSSLYTADSALRFTTESGAYPAQRDWRMEFKVSHTGTGEIAIASSLGDWRCYLDSSNLLHFEVTTSSGEGFGSEYLVGTTAIEVGTTVNVVLALDTALDKISLTINGVLAEQTLSYPAVALSSDSFKLAFGLGNTATDSDTLTLDDIKLFFPT